MHQVVWEDNGRTTTWMVPDGWVPLPPRAAAAFEAVAVLLVGNWAARVTDGGLLPMRPKRVIRSSASDEVATLRWIPRPDLARRLPATALEQEGTRSDSPQDDAHPLTLTVPDGHTVAWPAGGTILIGRHPLCHIRLEDPRVSSFHCALRAQRTCLLIVDLNSRNGTWFDETRLAAATIGRQGCLRVGRSRLFVQRPRQVELTPLPSRPMRDLLVLADRVATADAPVLIQGESGAGKEGLARRLHEHSGRVGRFVTLNAATLSAELAGSQLFGHEAGAFTGAERSRPGAFVTANRGTLFLDEVAELSSEVQAELLRVIEHGEVRPLGATDVIAVDVRLVTATHRDLATRVRAGHFREDLFHRIAVLPLCVPPLRERIEDVDAIADAFLARQKPPRRLTPAARQLLRSHDWPGNIRQLLNVLARACVLNDARVLGIDHLEIPSSPRAGSLDEVIRDSVLETYDSSGHSVAATAKQLGLHRATVYRHLNNARVSRPRARS